jgi:hypothetical protein
MTTLLGRQLEAYERSLADPAEIDGRRLDGVLEVGLALYRATQAAVRSWNAAVAAGQTPFTREAAEQWLTVYRRFDRDFDRIAGMLRANGSAGVSRGVEASFTEERMSLKAMLRVPLDRLFRAEEQADRGETRTSGEVRDALRRRVHG